MRPLELRAHDAHRVALDLVDGADGRLDLEWLEGEWLRASANGPTASSKARASRSRFIWRAYSRIVAWRAAEVLPPVSLCIVRAAGGSEVLEWPARPCRLQQPPLLCARVARQGRRRASPTAIRDNRQSWRHASLRGRDSVLRTQQPAARFTPGSVRTLEHVPFSPDAPDGRQTRSRLNCDFHVGHQHTRSHADRSHQRTHL